MVSGETNEEIASCCLIFRRLCVLPGAESKSWFLKRATERHGEQEHIWTCSSKKSSHKCKCQLKTITKTIPSAYIGVPGVTEHTCVCAFIYEAHNHNDNEEATPYTKQGLTEWEMGMALEKSRLVGGSTPTKIAYELNTQRQQLRGESRIITNVAISNALYVRCPKDVEQDGAVKKMASNAEKKKQAVRHLVARSLKKLQPLRTNSNFDDKSLRPNGSPQRATVFRTQPLEAAQVLGVTRVMQNHWLPANSMAAMAQAVKQIEQTDSNVLMQVSSDKKEWCVTIASNWGLQMVADAKEHAWWGIPSASVDWTPNAASGDLHLINFALRGMDGRAYFPVVALCSNQTTWTCDAFKDHIAQMVTKHTGATFNLRHWYIAQDNAGAISASARNGIQYQIDDWWHMKRAIVKTLPKKITKADSSDERARYGPPTQPPPHHHHYYHHPLHQHDHRHAAKKNTSPHMNQHHHHNHHYNDDDHHHDHQHNQNHQ